MTVDCIGKNRFDNGFSLLTTGEVAGLLGVHQNTVRRWSDSGLLKSFRISQRGDRRYRFEDVSAFLESMNETGFDSV